MYKLNQMFYSLQGEGRNAGRTALFIRLSGCNLECQWCDEDNDVVRAQLGAGSLAAKALFTCSDKPCPDLIVFTGGEPFQQLTMNLVRTVRNAFEQAYEEVPMVCVESNGTLAYNDRITDLDEAKHRGIDFITLSPKHLNGEIPVVWQSCSEVRVVLDDQIDPAPFIDCEDPQYIAASDYYISPCSEEFAPAIKYVMENKFWKLSLQTHKILDIE